jgi:LysR family transcriptional regulator, glycine cleavage system transcriptional activator
MRRRLPPLNALRAFEATVRTGSISTAASELNVTHGAVSKQIQGLESALGHKLFLKQGQRLVTTAQGAAFASEIGEAFDRLADAVGRCGSSRMEHVLHIAAPATFAMRWLIPNLKSFYLSHPEIDIRIRTTTSNETIMQGAFDLIIRRSISDVGPSKTAFFLVETHTLMASPTLLDQIPLASPEEIQSHTMLFTETRPDDWEDWVRAAGIQDRVPTRRHRFDHFFVTLQAAIDGLGLMIGPMPVLRDDLKSKKLIAPFPHIQCGTRYYTLERHRGTRESDVVALFRNWLATTGEAAMAKAG